MVDTLMYIYPHFSRGGGQGHGRYEQLDLLESKYAVYSRYFEWQTITASSVIPHS
jgi:hypothetical protein